MYSLYTLKMLARSKITALLVVVPSSTYLKVVLLANLLPKITSDVDFLLLSKLIPCCYKGH